MKIKFDFENSLKKDEFILFILPNIVLGYIRLEKTKEYNLGFTWFNIVLTATIEKQINNEQ